jgi:hypothetical protein
VELEHNRKMFGGITGKTKKVAAPLGGTTERSKSAGGAQGGN